MYFERQLPQVGGQTHSESVAPRTLFDELDFAVTDLRLGRFGVRRLRKERVAARGKLRPLAAVEPEGDNPVDVHVFDGGAARRDRPDVDSRSTIPDLNRDVLLAIHRGGHRRS